MGRSRTITETSTSRRVAAPVSLGLAGVAAVVAVAARDPHVAGSWGECPVLALTGFFCPGCGGLRAVYDLMHLHPVAAISSNAMVVAFVVVVGMGWSAWLWTALTQRSFDIDRYLTPRRVYLFMAALAVFTLVRNISVGAWLAP